MHLLSDLIPMSRVEDNKGRTFSKLRVSLTEECNFSCTYCVEDETFINGNKYHPIVKEIRSNAIQKVLSAKELVEKIKIIHSINPLQSVRLTGGEPLLYAHLAELLEGMAPLSIPRVSITTNGYLLRNFLAVLETNGVTDINISLDSIDETVFQAMSKKPGLSNVLRGIDFALSRNFSLKLNSVIMKGVNDNQVVPLLEYALDRNITIRYIELMKMGYLFQNDSKLFFPEKDILSLISQKFKIDKEPRSLASTANYWQVYPKGRFGIIANESSPFCADCNRLRIDSYGNLFGCLSRNDGTNISKINNRDKVRAVMQELIYQKQEYKFTGSTLVMRNIGG